jgi:hypothetical protein
MLRADDGRRPIMKKLALFIAAGVIALVTFGCSNTVSKADMKSELVANGLSESVATCIVDGMEAKGLAFRKYGDLTPAEQGVITDCVSKEFGVPANP